MKLTKKIAVPGGVAGALVIACSVCCAPLVAPLLAVMGAGALGAAALGHYRHRQDAKNDVSCACQEVCANIEESQCRSRT